jgi:predicted transcriptional regulator
VTDDAIDEIAFLTRSPVRVRVLHALRRRGPVDKRELRGLVDGVRTTVTRNLNALVERGWIEDGPEGYAITDCGRMIVDDLIALTESASLAVELRPALRWLDIERLGLDLRHFERADITTADSTNPYAPVEEQVALLRRATTVRTALPTVNRQILEACRRTARADGGDVEIVLGAAAVDRLRSTDRYAELFADVCRYCTVWEYEGTLPYYVGDAGDAVQLGTTDGDNLIRVLLRFDVDDDVRAWADDRFERFEQRAQRVETPE